MEPTGIAVDAAGKVWASNLGSSTASRINPATNTVDLTVSLGAGAGPYNYSDMTGSTLTGAPDDGTWSAVYDSGRGRHPWAFLDWAAQLPGDASFTVTVASSANGTTFGPEVAVTAGEEISGLADGRYLRVTARFTRSTAGESPVLFDLTVAHAGDRANTLAYQWRLVDIDGPPVFLSSATSPTPSFVAPDDASYTFELTVTDSAGLSDTDEVTVAVTNLDPTVEAEIGSAFARSVTLVNASFTDPGWLDVHSASFNWGDGTAVEPMAVTAQGTGWGSFFGSHVYASAGSYHVTVTLTDDDGGSATVDLGQVSVAEPVAVWANSKTAAKTFDWTGGGGSITGRVHSNREVKIAGTLPKSIIGPTEYVTTITVSGPHTVTPVQSTVQPYPGHLQPRRLRAGRQGRHPGRCGVLQPHLELRERPLGRRQPDPARRRPLRAVLDQGQRLVDRRPSHPRRNGLDRAVRLASRLRALPRRAAPARRRQRQQGHQRLGIKLEVPRRPVRRSRRDQPVRQQQQVLLRDLRKHRQRVGLEPDRSRVQLRPSRFDDLRPAARAGPGAVARGRSGRDAARR